MIDIAVYNKFQQLFLTISDQDALFVAFFFQNGIKSSYRGGTFHGTFPL